MENKGKTGKGKIRVFTQKSKTAHFTPSQSIPSDVLGSYTGTPVNSYPDESFPDVYPIQDADDL